MSRKTLLLSVFLFLIFSCSKKDDPTPQQNEDQFAFAGKWLGNWSDSLFPAVSVSADVIKLSSNKYSGAFYYNSNGNAPYTPGYGGANDGLITFETKGDSVLHFLFSQNAPDYKGGCPGTYKGDGLIDKNSNRLIINFEGEDCDGLHQNGKIIWRLDK